MEGKRFTTTDGSCAQEEGPQSHQPAANTTQVIDGTRAPSSYSSLYTEALRQLIISNLDGHSPFYGRMIKPRDMLWKQIAVSVNPLLRSVVVTRETLEAANDPEHLDKIKERLDRATEKLDRDMRESDPRWKP